MKNAWTYYVNQLNEADRFIKELTDELSKSPMLFHVMYFVL